MRRAIHLPNAIRMLVIGIGVLGFAAGSLSPNAVGGAVALVSALCIIFVFFFTESTSATPEAEETEGPQQGR